MLIKLNKKCNIFAIFILLLSTMLVNKAHAKAPLCRQILSPSPKYTFADELEINKITPGQEELGRHIVQTDKIPETATLKELEVPVIAVVLKSGVHYILQDRHHTMTGFAENFGYDHKVKLNILEEHIYPDMSDADYARLLIEEQKMYFSNPEIDDDWSFEKDWPQNIKDLIDSPIRALVKLALNKNNISGKNFIPFFQFYLKELADLNGLFDDEEITYSDEQVEKLQLFLFTNKPAFRAFIRMINPNLKSNKRKTIKDKLRKIRDKLKGD